MKRLIFAVGCACPFAFAQSLPRLPEIDGKIDDPVWQTVAPQALVTADRAVPAGSGGQIRAIVLGRYIFVAARLPEPTGRFSARVTGRNPTWEDEDLLRITAGADIGYTDRILSVNPLGAYSVEKGVFVSYRNEPTFPYADEWARHVVYQNVDKFLVATSTGEREWIVEAAIPLNELSAPASDPILVSAERIRAMRPGSPRQRWHWPQTGPAAKLPGRRSDQWDTPVPLHRPVLRGNQEPPLQVGQLKTLPPQDSGWNDSPWSGVPALQLTRDEPSPRLPQFQTQVKLLHDGRTLGVLARCEEPGTILATVRENDGPIDQEDNFQVLLATSGSAYTRYAVNPLGYLLDSHGFAGGQRVSRAREWNSGARVTVSKEAGAWLVRVDVPLDQASESLGEPRIPRDWRVLLVRNRPGRDGDPTDVGVFPVIESPTPLCPARYRRLTLTESGPAEIPRRAEQALASGISLSDTRVFSPEQRKQMDLSRMLERHMRQRTQKIVEEEKSAWEQVTSRASWEQFRDPRLKALAASLGEFPAKTPLMTRVNKEYVGEGYRRLDLAYQSRPGLWVTSNLYLPEKPAGQMPGMLIIHSHHRPRTQAELQDMGILWARAGSAVLIPDMIGHGERLETYPWNREGYHSRYMTGMQLYVAGESLMKWMAWDVIRGLDLLLARKDVDPERILLLGAVAAGGDPAAVVAALDPRVTAVVPFNFGEASPAPGRSAPAGEGRSSTPRAGSGSWESTRNLAGSISGRFLPWFICASVAPRKFVYSYEMGWNVEDAPAWERYRKVFGLYDAIDNLDEAHGFGTFPGPGECANIGPAQRKTLYPELNRWFGIPVPAKEPDDRRPEDELAALSPAIAAELRMRPVHALAREIAESKLKVARSELAKLPPDARAGWLKKALAAKLGDPTPYSNVRALSHWRRQRPRSSVEGISLEMEAGIIVPVLLLHPVKSAHPRRPVVVVVSQDGKDRILAQRAHEIEALLGAGVAVCLPDVRGTGETSADARRGPSSAEVRLAATELMLGGTLLGARLKDLRSVLAYLRTRDDIDRQQIALWGDSSAAPNPAQLAPDEAPNWQVGPEIQHQGEPLGGLLAILGGLFDENVRAVVAYGGLASYVSILEDPFVYVSKSAIVPGIVEAGDISDMVAVLAPRPVLLERMVDGRNRLQGAPAKETDIASWLLARVK